MSRFDELGYTPRRKEIEVPGCASKVNVRELTTKEWVDALSLEAEKQKPRLVSLAVLTSSGDPVFEIDDPEVARFGQAAINSIVLQVGEMNQAGVDAAKN